MAGNLADYWHIDPIFDNLFHLSFYKNDYMDTDTVDLVDKIDFAIQDTNMTRVVRCWTDNLIGTGTVPLLPILQSSTQMQLWSKLVVVSC
jgi:hypothetical protein